MWKEICCFEIKYHLRQPLFHISATILCLLALMLVSTAASAVFADTPRNAGRDAPIVIVRYLTVFSIIGLFVITALVASAVLRDFEQGTHMLFFTKPVRKFDYLMGRFTGSMAISLALFLLVTLAMVAGRFVPWQDAERLGPFSVAPYLYGLLVLVMPNELRRYGDHLFPQIIEAVKDRRGVRFDDCNDGVRLLRLFEKHLH